MDMPDFTRDEIIAKIAAGESLEGADLEGVDLQGADLSGANLRWADLREAKYNKDTRFPEGFDPEAEGVVLVE